MVGGGQPPLHLPGVLARFDTLIFEPFSFGSQVWVQRNRKILKSGSIVCSLAQIAVKSGPKTERLFSMRIKGIAFLRKTFGTCLRGEGFHNRQGGDDANCQAKAFAGSKYQCRKKKGRLVSMQGKGGLFKGSLAAWQGLWEIMSLSFCQFLKGGQCCTGIYYQREKKCFCASLNSPQ